MPTKIVQAITPHIEMQVYSTKWDKFITVFSGNVTRAISNYVARLNTFHNRDSEQKMFKYIVLNRYGQTKEYYSTKLLLQGIENTELCEN